MRRTLIALLALSVPRRPALATAPASTAADQYPVSYNFLSSAVLAGANIDADPPGANDFGCRPTAQHPRPVVLVHGTAGNKNTNWQTYAPLLANNGYCVFALTYGVARRYAEGSRPVRRPRQDRDERRTAQDVRDQGAQSDRRAAGRHPRSLPGHADAGLLREVPRRGAVHPQLCLARAALARHQPRSTRPAEPVDERLRRPPSTDTPGCAACSEMCTGSAFMQKMRAGGVAVKGISYTNIVTKYDELVSPYTSGIEPGMTQHHRPGQLRHRLHRALRDRRRPGRRRLRAQRPRPGAPAARPVHHGAAVRGPVT